VDTIEERTKEETLRKFIYQTIQYVVVQVL